ncbi:poly [ADP-ribose] polymerase tankyrase-2-like [Uloborus diversus]|uniref:poly [ADP-ribose] polymerase tankyrase-2-like n=1 Tax=Uloborus diversus TaxID=327109 RepID=UPI002409DC2E|nr:poly [ADP-ribose] polymerase tankyrase-2-like [Uloborus diversus]
MAAVSEDPITLWLKLGALEKLEQVVLDGYGDQLYGKTSRIPQVNKFLRQVPLFQNKIDEIHKAVSTGNLRDVQHLIDRKKLAFCRDHMGASPMHKAVLFSQKPIIDYLLDRYPSVVHARDHRGRTPLHYAAVLNDNGEIYQMLLDHGADIKATDVYGNRPEYYMHAQEEMNIDELKEGNEPAKTVKPVKIRHFITNGGSPQKEAKSAKPAGTRTQIRELISHGSIDALEELVLHGHGDRLLGESGTNPLVRDFIRMVPIYMDGRTPLHYAAALKDGHEAYNMLIALGANPLILDYRGKTAEYYLQFPEHLHLEQLIKQSQRANANYIANNANRIKLASPKRRLEINSANIKRWVREEDLEKLEGAVLEGYGDKVALQKSDNIKLQQYISDQVPLLVKKIEAIHSAVSNDDLNELQTQLHETDHMVLAKDQFGINGAGSLPQVVMDKITKWLQNGELDHIKEFVHEGYGQHLVGKTSWSEDVKHYLKTVPVYLMNLGSAFHAVEKGDIATLDKHVTSDENLLKAKNSEGSTLIHHAVLHDQLNVLNYFLDRHPSILNNKDRTGRTPLHVAGQQKNQYIYTILAAAGADPMILDQKGRTAEFYMSSTSKPSTKAQVTPSSSTPENESSGEKSNSPTEKTPEEPKEPEIVTPDPDDRLNDLIDVWIRDKDLLRLEHVVIAGQGERLIGRTSEDRQVQEFLDLVPTYMARIKGVHDAVVRGNLGEVESVLTRKRFALSRDHLGASPLHLAVLHGHTDIVKYIIDNFPEALDGPDNEGRTPLHYAAVMRDGGNYYRILLMAGADETVVDKTNHTPDYYLTHPGVLTIRDLLEGYRIKDPQRRPSQVNIWQRPPTDDADKHNFFDGGDDRDLFDEPEPGNTPDYSDPSPEPPPEEPEEQPEEPQQSTSIYPILFDRQNRDSRYLASVLGDALIKGLSQVAQRRPKDPIGYLATYLYQYAARNSTAISQTPTSQEDEMYQTEKIEEIEIEEPKESESHTSPVKAEATDIFTDSNQDSQGCSATKLDVLEEDPEEYEDDDDELSLEFEDHTKMKDESGQTVLHFASTRVHPDGSFYGLLSHAEVLLAERDALYRTCRDMAEETGQEENIATIDRYVFDAYLQERSSFIHMLMHEGYDHLIHINDTSRRDVGTVLQQQRLRTALSLLREVTDFVKRREELHGCIRNRFLEGVCRLIKSDSTLVTAKGTRARCALHVAVLFEHIGVINALVRANSSAVHVADNLGRTPLHYAMATEKVDKIAKILVKAGALRTCKDVRMRTPSYFFIYKDEIEKLYEEESRLA